MKLVHSSDPELQQKIEVQRRAKLELGQDIALVALANKTSIESIEEAMSAVGLRASDGYNPISAAQQQLFEKGYFARDVHDNYVLTAKGQEIYEIKSGGDRSFGEVSKLLDLVRDKVEKDEQLKARGRSILQSLSIELPV